MNSSILLRVSCSRTSQVPPIAIWVLHLAPSHFVTGHHILEDLCISLGDGGGVAIDSLQPNEVSCTPARPVASCDSYLAALRLCSAGMERGFSARTVLPTLEGGEQQIKGC